jgi:omega-3 fatty acid desaturase (delta-15 desaturase)
MGKGGHNTRLDGNNEQQFDSTTLLTQHRLPTLSEIKVKLPAHCFRPTVRQSMSYVFKDIIYVALTFFLMYQLEKLFQYGFLFFPIYWYIQGLLMIIIFLLMKCCLVGTLYTSFFVLGHDCGHGSFSIYPLLNDIVGMYFSTKKINLIFRM